MTSSNVSFSFRPNPKRVQQNWTVNRFISTWTLFCIVVCGATRFIDKLINRKLIDSYFGDRWIFSLEQRQRWGCVARLRLTEPEQDIWSRWSELTVDQLLWRNNEDPSLMTTKVRHFRLICLRIHHFRRSYTQLYDSTFDSCWPDEPLFCLSKKWSSFVTERRRTWTENDLWFCRIPHHDTVSIRSCRCAVKSWRAIRCFRNNSDCDCRFKPSFSLQDWKLKHQDLQFLQRPPGAPPVSQASWESMLNVSSRNKHPSTSSQLLYDSLL